MSDSEAIRNLVASYSLEADARNVAAWVSLFAEDGVLILNDEEQAQGPVALHDWFAGREMPPAFHMIANLRIDVDGGDARGIANFIAVGPDRLIGARGIYHARFVRRAGDWKISEWRIEVA